MYMDILNEPKTPFEEFEEAFLLLDKKGDNKIDVSQIGDALRAIGQNPKEADLLKYVQHKREERISLEAFLPIYQAISKRNMVVNDLEYFVEGLRHFDKDGNGFLSSTELRRVLTGLGEKMTDEEVDQLLGHEYQEYINYEEFVEMIMAG